MSTYEKLEKENREYIVKKLGEFFGNTEDHIVEVLHDKLGTEAKTFTLRDTKDSKEYSIVWAPQTVFTSEGAYLIERATISVYPVREASYTHLFTDCIINANKFNKRVLTSKGIKLSSSKVNICNDSSEFNIGETSEEEMTLKQWHDTQKAAESIVKKLNSYYLNILKQKIVDYSHFTIEEFHELASELLTIQCAEEEKTAEQEREKELEEERESEGFKIEDSIKVQVDDEEFHFINLKTSRGFSIPVNISNFGFLDVEKFIEKLENTKKGG